MKPFKEHHLLHLLNQLNSSSPLDLSISQYFRQHKSLGSKDRKFIAETAYNMIRWLGLIDYFTSNPKTWEKRFEAYKDLNIENESNNLNIPEHVRVSFPKYLFSKFVESYGHDKAFELALLSNQRASLTIRVNTQKISREQLLQILGPRFAMKPCLKSPVGLRLDDYANLFETEEFKLGYFEVQDEASQLAALLTEAKPKQKILDYCSGSGGKSLAIAPLMNNEGCIYLHDIRPNILIQAKKRFKRAGIFHYQIAAPNSSTLKKLIGSMDWVLLDVPCTGTGTYRRNPDLKWKFNAQMLEEVLQTQRMIFAEAIRYLKPKGKIVYSTCSLLQDENDKQVSYFIEQYGFKLINKPLNSATDFANMDGFYGAILEKA